MWHRSGRRRRRSRRRDRCRIQNPGLAPRAALTRATDGCPPGKGPGASVLSLAAALLVRASAGSLRAGLFVPAESCLVPDRVLASYMLAPTHFHLSRACAALALSANHRVV